MWQWSLIRGPQLPASFPCLGLASLSLSLSLQKDDLSAEVDQKKNVRFGVLVNAAEIRLCSAPRPVYRPVKMLLPVVAPRVYL